MDSSNVDELIKRPEFIRADRTTHASVVLWPKWYVEYGAAIGLCDAADSREAQKEFKVVMARVAAERPDFGLLDGVIKRVCQYETKFEVVYAGPPVAAAGKALDEEDDEKELGKSLANDDHPAPKSLLRPVPRRLMQAAFGMRVESRIHRASDARLFFRRELAGEVTRLRLNHEQANKRGEEQPTELETRIAVSRVLLSLGSRLKVDGRAWVFQDHWRPVTPDGLEAVPHAVVDGFRLKPARLTGDIEAKLASRFEHDGASRTAVYMHTYRGVLAINAWTELTTELAEYCRRERIGDLLILK